SHVSCCAEYLPVLVLLSSSGDPRDLHSFPTRRSSDLHRRRRPKRPRLTCYPCRHRRTYGSAPRAMACGSRTRPRAWVRRSSASRSEEHTSELQSLTNLVCRLLLEKKKHTHYLYHT